MTVEPMTDAELEMVEKLLDPAGPHMWSGLKTRVALGIIARLRAAEAERDAAVARAMPEWRWRPIESAPHNELVLLYCPDRGPTNRERIELGYASHGSRSAISSSLSQHAWATMWRPLPDLPTPTAAQEG